MRILVVVGSEGAARGEAVRSASKEVTVSFQPPVAKLQLGDSEVHYRAIQTERDADRLRGLRYDVVIEEGSFNPHRNVEKGTLLELCKYIVLR